MAKIISPSNLNQATEVVIDSGAKTIQLLIAGNLSTDGVQLQALYSFLKEEWKTDANLIKFLFPMVAITEEQFELVNGWDFADTTTRELIRDGGWALKDGSGTSQEEWMNVTTLGAFDDAGVDNAYYLQVDAGIPTDIVLTGEVNQAIQIYGDATHGNFDYRTFFKIYLREQGKVFAFYDLISEQNITALTYKKFAMPLSNGTDLKIAESDVNIAANAPYTGMSITYYAIAQQRDIGGTDRDFDIIIDGNLGTAEEIYEFVQYSLRQTSDIDAGAGTVRGDTADDLLQFIGDTLQTKIGVYIDNFQAADTNRIEFTDTTGTIRTFPFVAAGNIAFNDNLQNDAGAFYRIFFTNDDAGSNLGYDFGTTDAITLQDTSLSEIAGDVSAAANVGFDYDYDGNVQRGAGSGGTDVPYVAVASGLGTAQYVVTTGTLVRSTSNVINFVAALERNYKA